MKKRKQISMETRRTIRLKFLTEEGKTYTIDLAHASAELAGAEGSAAVKRVMEKMIELDVLKVRLVKIAGAELVERRVILIAEDGGSVEAKGEDEAGNKRMSAGGARRQRQERRGGFTAALFKDIQPFAAKAERDTPGSNAAFGSRGNKNARSAAIAACSSCQPVRMNSPPTASNVTAIEIYYNY